MTTSPPNFTELAKQGNPGAIAALMNRSLQPKGITAKVAAIGNNLQIRLESAQVPNQAALVKFVHKGLTTLAVESIQTVHLSGYLLGEAAPAWEEDIELSPSHQIPTPLAAEPLQTVTDSAEEGDESIDLADTEAEDAAAADLDFQEQPRKSSSAAALLQNRSALILGAIVLLLGLGALAYFFYPRPQPAPVAIDPTSVNPTSVNPTSVNPTSPAPTATAPTPSTAATSPEASPEASPDASPEAANPESTEESPAPEAASPSPSPDASPTPTASTTPFRDAVNQAMAAAEATQTAATPDQWQQVADQWQSAIDLLKQVPAEDTNAAIAQEKITEYERNLDYAVQRASDGP
jgi:cytoskeletal protein RodZ